MATVLVVEDDPMIRDVLWRLLQIEGYRVITAENGVQGVQHARVSRPDLIVMDMGLPLLNGHIPIIALTAYAMQEDRNRCISVGCNEYESKPVDFPRLAAKIRDQLQRAQLPLSAEPDASQIAVSS
jgi:two-component system, cell cycle response regulator DivK